MFSAFQTFGKLGALASSVARAWTPLALWPDGISSAGMWISPSTLPASFNDSSGTMPVATPGTVADSVNPVGLALDIRAGATALADPGNHMLQASTTARPLESARVNLLTKTEDASWFTDGVTQSQAVGPTGLNDAVAQTVTNVVTGYIYAGAVSPAGYTTCRAYLKAGNADDINLTNGPNGARFNLAAQTVVNIGSGVGTIENYLNGYYECTVVINNAVDTSVFYLYAETRNLGSVSFYFWHPQLNLGSTALPYQSVPGDGSTYDATGITPFQIYDGIDDGMATASFAAGTLINGMDCMIPVRRDSTAEMIIGLYASALGSKWLGRVNNYGDSSDCVMGAGNPTVFVDNVQLPARTVSALNDALTVDEFNILEFRGLDLSAWTAAQFGNFAYGYNFLGARGDIMLFPSPADATERDKARQYLADKYGVTLA